MDPTKPRDRYLRVSTVSELTALSKSYCYYLVDSGVLAHVKHGRKKGIRVLESSLNEYLRKLRDGE